ncbi:MAG: polysaccharide pyruvyl transferase family protein [Thermoleophilia bacterium]
MRIVIEHGEHQHRNRGDVAMLQVAVDRLRSLWPDAELAVVTGDPELLAELVPGALPIRLTAGRVSRVLRRGADPLAGADLLAAIGGGYLTDVDPEQSERVLGTIERAQERGIPCVLFGQGIGPLRDPALRELAARVLPKCALIALRESVTGAPLLAELGVPGEKVTVTGDDAIPLARAGAPESLGQGLAVNHRLASYLETDDAETQVIRGAVHAAAFDRGAALIPIPVSEWDDDRPGTARITEGYPLVEHPDAPSAPPQWAIARLDRARLVVTSTYHLAVFALSRGIPAVCVASSDYYRHKFQGLANLFGPGCTVVDLGTPDPATALVSAIDALWESADMLRPGLLAAADRQIALGEAAYARAQELVTPEA